jgi:hypothetical protein
MILEDATYEAFGYFPENLTCGSHSCHAKTNGNRDYWEKKIIELLDLQGGVSDFI